MYITCICYTCNTHVFHHIQYACITGVAQLAMYVAVDSQPNFLNIEFIWFC